MSRIIITLLKSYDEEGRDHFALQRADTLLKVGIRDDPDDYRFRAGTPNEPGLPDSSRLYT